MVDLAARTPVTRHVLAGLAGLGVIALGLLAPWVAAPSAPSPLAPGLVLLALTAVPTWFDRRAPSSAMATFLAAAWIVVGGVWEGGVGRDVGSGGALAGTLLLAAGLLACTVSGVLGVLTPVDDSGRRAGGLPRRLPRLVAAAGMLVDAAGDALPEGLHPDGPGPVLFLILGVVVAAVPNRAVVAVAGLLSLSMLVGGLATAELPARLAGPSQGLVLAGAGLQTVGLVLAVACCIIALLPARRAGRP